MMLCPSAYAESYSCKVNIFLFIDGLLCVFIFSGTNIKQIFYNDKYMK